MVETRQRGEARERAYWLALRGAQQMDLAERFSAAAAALEVSVLALKGISIAEALYGGVGDRPMADIDLLVVDRSRFADACRLARDLGLVECGASDHDVVFQEPLSGVLLELHLSLTSCPGLFSIDHHALWSRRVPVQGSTFFRLGDVDLVVHLALHTAFQHGFAAGPSHFEDFVRAVDRFRPSTEEVVSGARAWGALGALAAMARVSSLKYPESPGLSELAAAAASAFPSGLAAFLEGLKEQPAPFRIGSLARVRCELAPSRRRWLGQSLFPAAAPGQMLPRRGRLIRLMGLVRAGMRPIVSSTAGQR